MAPKDFSAYLLAGENTSYNRFASKVGQCQLFWFSEKIRYIYIKKNNLKRLLQNSNLNRYVRFDPWRYLLHNFSSEK